MKKAIGWLVTLLLLAGIGFGVWRWQKGRQVVKIDYKTDVVKRKSIVGRVTASGTLQAKVTVQVGAQVSGRLVKINADFNSTVKKGDLIAQIDPQLFLAAVAKEQANYVSAKANVAKSQAQQRDAELVLQRTRALAEQTLATAADLQTAETTFSVARATTDVSRASLLLATASLNQAKVNLSYTNIYSPIDGTVISRAVDVGQTVAASMQAPVLFTIAEDLHSMQVYTSISESDVGRLEAGMTTTFTVDAFPGQKFRGKVGQIRNAAQTVQNVVTYNAVIDAENPNLKLRPGMTATVSITYAEREDVLAITNGALRFRPPADLVSSAEHSGPFPNTPGAASSERSPGSSGQRPNSAGKSGAGRSGSGDAAGSSSRAVWLLKGGKPAAASITTGLSDGTVTEIVSGDVHEGDLAITDASQAGAAAVPTSTASQSGGARMGRMF